MDTTASPVTWHALKEMFSVSCCKSKLGSIIYIYCKILTAKLWFSETDTTVKLSTIQDLHKYLCCQSNSLNVTLDHWEEGHNMGRASDVLSSWLCT